MKAIIDQFQSKALGYFNLAGFTAYLSQAQLFDQ
jgi:hypothetical protein